MSITAELCCIEPARRLILGNWLYLKSAVDPSHCGQQREFVGTGFWKPGIIDSATTDAEAKYLNVIGKAMRTFVLDYWGLPIALLNEHEVDERDDMADVVVNARYGVDSGVFRDSPVLAIDDREVRVVGSKLVFVASECGANLTLGTFDEFLALSEHQGACEIATFMAGHFLCGVSAQYY